jgi:hypothetical protein
MLTCPVCRSETIRRSGRRNFFERVWSLVGRYPYRCHDCQTRFFAIREPKKSADKVTKPVETAAKQPQYEEDDDD